MNFKSMIFAGLVAAGAIFGRPAAAEVTEVRFAQQVSMTYLQFNVMAHENLIEKQAAKLGIPNLKVTWARIDGSNAMNDALLAGAVDFVCGGVPGMLTLWGKTFGTPQEVRGVTALGHFGVLLNTVNPNIKSIRDFTEKDKIAVPAVKVSHQAIVLAMAAAKEWGFEHWEKLDPLTITMNAADQTVGLLSGGGNFQTSFASLPFTILQLKDSRVRTVLKSWDIIGDITSSVLWSSKKFHDANPKVYRAVVEALKEATEIIRTDKRRAVTYYVQDSKTSMSVDELVAMLEEPHYGLDVTPVGVQNFADFMHKTGRLNIAPKSWKDMFFEEIHDLKGS